MRVVVTSDFHGHVPADDVEPCDLLVVAGDCLGGCDLARLGDWLGRQPAQRIVGIAGNHDRFTPGTEERVRALPWTFLHDEATTVKDDGRDVVVYGSPWSVTFGGWSFMASDADLAERWARIPDATEVLVVHGPAARINDKVANRTSVGSVTLRDRVERLPRLRLLATGHIHEAYGITRMPRHVDGRVEWWPAVNGSYVNGGFRAGTQPPLAVTI